MRSSSDSELKSSAMDSEDLNKNGKIIQLANK